MAAYFVFNYRITDQEAYGPYLAEVPKTLEGHGAEILVADFESDVIEGDAGHVSVVLKFPSKAAARKWYDSAEYQAILQTRRDNSVGIATLVNAAGT